MIINVDKISSCDLPHHFTHSGEIYFNNFKRYFDGGFNPTFYEAFSNIRDVKYKNHTTFYLTDEKTHDQIIKSDKNIIKSDSILSSLDFGGSFLTFKQYDKRKLGELGIYNKRDLYGNYGFENIKSGDTNFTIEFSSDNKCEIYFTFQYKKYYLTVNGNELDFYSKKLELGDTVLDYSYSESSRSIFLFFNTLSSMNFVQKSGDKITLVPITSDNISTIYLNPIKLDRSIRINSNINNNFTIISYNNDNNLIDKLMTNVQNNFLIHRELDDQTEIITLKNQLTQNDIFTSGNNLISSTSIPYFMEEMREYTSIFHDIPNIHDESLDLNYVLYNKEYEINPGENTFTAPTSMLPFLKININDTKFVDSGSFPYTTPKYADRICKKEDDITYDDGQKYLCTWLSGSPLGNEGIWVDRYYYPDLISKKEALENNSTFNITYENQIENLIKNNTSIQQSITSFSVFDKASDLTFEPNKKYIYKRLQAEIFETFTPIEQCGVDSLNYFKNINDKGEFSIYFYFDGENPDWILESGRNKINAGTKISKIDDVIHFEYILFNSSNESYQTFKESSSFTNYKENFIGISVNAKKGTGYYFINNNILKQFAFDPYQFLGKQILFGDFILNDNIKKFNVLEEYIEPELMAIKPILEGRTQIDKIYITLPCGMRNSSDNVEYIRSICNNQSFKSNDFNVIIRNLDVSDQIKQDIDSNIYSKIKNITPVTSNINKIYYDEYD